MFKGIIVCGLNGSGKSTLGKELAKKLNYSFLDIEDYYFPNRDADYVYEVGRSKEEVERLLLEDMKKMNNFVLAAVRGNYGKEVISFLSIVVNINVDKQIRLQRVKERSFQKFGNRIFKGGDLYEKEHEFFKMVESRSELMVDEWLHTIDCNILNVDGTRPIKENVEQIVRELLEDR